MSSIEISNQHPATHPELGWALLYEQNVEEIKTVDGLWLGIDLGVDNLATCCDWRGYLFTVDGRHLKSLNRCHNRKIAHHQSKTSKGSTTRLNVSRSCIRNVDTVS
ncbi:MAG: transposase, partial [halophilic archaeon J07HX5]